MFRNYMNTVNLLVGSEREKFPIPTLEAMYFHSLQNVSWNDFDTVFPNDYGRVDKEKLREYLGEYAFFKFAFANFPLPLQITNVKQVSEILAQRFLTLECEGLIFDTVMKIGFCNGKEVSANDFLVKFEALYSKYSNLISSMTKKLERNEYAICQEIEKYFRGKKMIALKEVINSRFETVFEKYDTFTVQFVEANYLEKRDTLPYFEVRIVLPNNKQVDFCFTETEKYLMGKVQSQFYDIEAAMNGFYQNLNR